MVVELDVEATWVDSEAGLDAVVSALYEALRAAEERATSEDNSTGNRSEVVEIAGRSVWKGAVVVGMDCEWAEADTPEVVQLALGGQAWVIDTSAGMSPSYLHKVRALLGLLFSAPSLRAARALPTRDGAPELVASRHNTADSKPNSNINVDATTNMDTNTTANTNTSIDIDAKAQGIGNSLLYVVGFAFSRDLRKLAALAPDLAPLLLPQGEEGPSNLIDLQKITSEEGLKGKGGGLVSLRGLCERLLGMTLDKAEQCSDWAVRPLSASQLRYAALDARLLSHHLLPRLRHSSSAPTPPSAGSN